MRRGAGSPRLPRAYVSAPQGSRRDSERPRAARGREPGTGRVLFRVGRFLAVVCVLCAVAAFPSSSLFALRSVLVRGNPTIPPEEILRLADVAPGESAFRVNAGDIRRRLLRDPRVQSVAVSLAFPQRLVVSVRERDPVAALVTDQGYVLLGADAVAIARAADPGGALPLAVDGPAVPWVQPGAPVPSAAVRFGASVASGLPAALRLRVTGLRIDTDGEVILGLRGGVAVNVGAADGLAGRLALVPGVLAAVRARGVHPEFVDLRFPGSVVVMPRGARQGGFAGGAAPGGTVPAVPAGAPPSADGGTPAVPAGVPSSPDSAAPAGPVAAPPSSGGADAGAPAKKEKPPGGGIVPNKRTPMTP